MITWRAVTFALALDTNPEERSSGVETNSGWGGLLRRLTSLTLRVSDVEREIRSLVPAEVEMTVSRDDVTGQVTAFILEAGPGGMRAEQIVQAVLILPSRVSNSTGSSVTFAARPMVVTTAVSAPPTPRQPPTRPPPSAPDNATSTPFNPVSDLDTPLSSDSALRSVDAGSGGAVTGGIVVVFLLLCLLAAAAAYRWQRHRMKAKYDCETAAIDIKVELSEDTQQARQKLARDARAGQEALAEALEPASVARDVPSALLRIRGLRMRNAPDAITPVKFGERKPSEEDSPAIGADEEEELDLEFEILRQNMERRAKTAENLPRLQKRRVEVQRAEAFMLAWQNRERSVLTKKLVHQLPAAHELRTFDPESFANRALVAQQTCVLVAAARRRARARLYAMDNSTTAAGVGAALDAITGSIQRASLTGGRLHARDLASQSARSGAECDGEPDANKWLLGVMTINAKVEPVEPALSPAVQNRLTRARSARKFGDFPEPPCIEPGLTTPSRKPRLTAGDFGGSASKTRSLSEIRAALGAATPSRPDGPVHQDLDPLTDMLHTASMLGMAPPPPPGDWRKDEVDLVTLVRDAPERVRRARSDREARLGLAAKSSPAIIKSSNKSQGEMNAAGMTLEPSELSTSSLHQGSSSASSRPGSPSSGGMLKLRWLSAESLAQQTRKSPSATESDGSSSVKDQASPPVGSPEQRVSPVVRDDDQLNGAHTPFTMAME